MAIAGALIGGAIGAFGKKPVVPTLKPIDPNATQAATVAGNQANFADIAKLATGVNTFNQDQLNALIDRVLPGARQQIQETLSSQLRGEIPKDVQNAIFRGNAERMAGSNAFGSPGGGNTFTNNVNARSLGLTSLQITNQALSSAESWLSKATAPTFDVTSMFFTPQQRLAFEQQQQGAQFQRDVMAAGVAAAPDPATAALGQEIDRFFNTAASAGMMMAGGGGIGGLAGGVGSAGAAAKSSGGGSPGGLGLYGGSEMGNPGMYYGGVGSAGGQGLPGIGQSNLNGSSMWGKQFNSFGF